MATNTYEGNKKKVAEEISYEDIFFKKGEIISILLKYSNYKAKT